MKLKPRLTMLLDSSEATPKARHAMSKAKHTKGPWKAEPGRPGRECHWTINTVKKYQIIDGTELYELPIALVENGSYRYEGNNGKAETTANARLIAKAWKIPEMVGLLNKHLAYMRQPESFDGEVLIGLTVALLAELEE